MADSKMAGEKNPGARRQSNRNRPMQKWRKHVENKIFSEISGAKQQSRQIRNWHPRRGESEKAEKNILKTNR